LVAQIDNYSRLGETFSWQLLLILLIRTRPSHLPACGASWVNQHPETIKRLKSSEPIIKNVLDEGFVIPWQTKQRHLYAGKDEMTGESYRNVEKLLLD